MTRGYQFTLPLGAGQSPPTAQPPYNLWSLIAATITDPYFGNTPYIPNIVKELRISFTFAVGNVGNSLSITNKLTGSEEDNLISGGLFVKHTETACIDLTQYNLTGSANNVIVDISITA